MIKLKNKIKDILRVTNIQAHTFILRKLMNVHCGNAVSTSGEDARGNNCFWVGTKKDVNIYYGFERYDETGFICKRYINNQFVDEQTIDENELINLDIEIIHYYKSNRIDIHGVYTFLYSFIIFKLLVIFTSFFGDLSQFFFNQRSLASKKRHEFLKLLIDNFTNHNGGFSYIEVMNSMHSMKVFVHPDFHKEASRIQTLLRGLVDTSELRSINGSYELTGHAFKALDDYEEEDRRHKSMNFAQWVLIFITIGMLFATLMQAQIIKLPTLLDFTK